MFLLVAVLAALSGAAILMIRERDIDHDLARGADGGDEGREPIAIREMLKDRRIATFIASVMLFHLANAAMLRSSARSRATASRAGRPC